MNRPETMLVRYDAACRALAEARSVDEVKDIRDKAFALKAYARQAKNKQLEIDAAEIRIRAERRLGQMLAEAPKNEGGRPSGKPVDTDDRLRLADLGITKDLSSRAQTIAAIPEPEFEQTLADHREEQQAVTGRTMEKLGRLGVHFSSESPEHYTPLHVIGAVRKMWPEGIDLDPCSNSHDEPNVPAKKHFTVDDDGLAQDWIGTVYINPPYGAGLDRWTQKASDEWTKGNASEILMLLPARTDTAWMRVLDDWPRCFISGRLTFIGNNDPAPFPSAVAYLGEDLERFYEAFHELGTIFLRWEPSV